MKKPNSLRETLTKALPALKKDPQKLAIFITGGRIIHTGTDSLSFEYAYTLRALLLDYAEHADAVMAPIVWWMKKNQPEVFDNPDFAQRFGILAYDDWNVIDICMGAGVHPFRDKSEADIAKFTETANLWVKNAKMITTDFVQLNLGLLNGDIDLYFTGGTYSIAGARAEGNNNLYAITPLSGPADGVIGDRSKEALTAWQNS